MQSLLENAVQSIQLGVEDYQANDPRRALSAVRNFYDGTLLLAKEVLRRKVPVAEAEEILSERYKPVPNGNGGVRYVPGSKRTIDFTTIGERFKDFGLKIDDALLQDLNRIRTDVTHYFTEKPREAMREAIAKAFPVVAHLFHLAGEEPNAILGEAWKVMLDVRAVYEQEIRACRATFDAVQWKSANLAEAPFSCPACHSDLVAQDDPTNKDQQSVDAHCRACGARISAEDAIVRALNAHFGLNSYIAAKEGGYQPVYECPECGVEAYVMYEDENGCALCEFALNDTCARCSADLTPDDAAVDNPDFCSYCYHVMSKDD